MTLARRIVPWLGALVIVLWFGTLAIVLWLGVLAGVSFIAGYAWKARGRWHRYRMGWHLMAFTVALTAALVGLLWESVDGIISDRIWYGMIVAIVTLMWHQTYLLITTNRDPAENRKGG